MPRPIAGRVSRKILENTTRDDKIASNDDSAIVLGQFAAPNRRKRKRPNRIDLYRIQLLPTRGVESFDILSEMLLIILGASCASVPTSREFHDV
jgi:hypothetical protein